MSYKKVEVGNVFEVYDEAEIWCEDEIDVETFFVRIGDKILILEKDKKHEQCKILILTGKHTGRIGYEDVSRIKDSYYFKKLRVAKND